MTTDTNSITRSVTIKASRSRVWQALTDHQQFSEWFKVAIDAPFKAGAPARGTISFKSFEGMKFEMVIERIEPESFFSWHWHPAAIDPKVDYTSEIPTRVTFELSEVQGGTKVMITESGFDKLPKHRYNDVLRLNTEGWRTQAENIREYVEKKAA